MFFLCVLYGFVGERLSGENLQVLKARRRSAGLYCYTAHGKNKCIRIGGIPAGTP
jgi:hypothetical protein